MSPGRKNFNKINQAAKILDVLVKKLPDEVLRDYFQNFSPEQGRKTLMQAIGTLAPKKENTPPSPSQTTLWQSNEKTWKGKLVGQVLQLFTDGASRGNPGEAGAGITILDEERTELMGTRAVSGAMH